MATLVALRRGIRYASTSSKAGKEIRVLGEGGAVKDLETAHLVPGKIHTN